MNKEKDILIRDFLEGELSEADAQYLKQYIDEDESVQEEVCTQYTVHNLLKALNIKECMDLENRICNSIDTFSDSEQDVCELETSVMTYINRIQRKWKFVTKGIAAVFILSAIVWFSYQAKKGNYSYAVLDTASEGVIVIGNNGVSQVLPNLSSYTIKDTTTINTQNSTGKVTFTDDNTTLNLSKETHVKLWQETGGKRIKIIKGNIYVHAAKQKEGKEVILITPNSKIKIVGTRFSIKVTEEATNVAVDEGRVSIQSIKTNELKIIDKGETGIVFSDSKMIYTSKSKTDSSSKTIEFYKKYYENALNREQNTRKHLEQQLASANTKNKNLCKRRLEVTNRILDELEQMRLLIQEKKVDSLKDREKFIYILSCESQIIEMKSKTILLTSRYHAKEEKYEPFIKAVEYTDKNEYENIIKKLDEAAMILKKEVIQQ